MAHPRNFIRILLLSIPIWICGTTEVIAQNAILTIGNATGSPGSTVTVPVSMNNDVPVAGIEFIVVRDPQVSVLDTITASNLTQNFTMSTNNQDDSTRVLIFDLGGSAIPVGEGIIGFITLSIKEDAIAGITPLQLQGAVVADADANSTPVTVVQGMITVIEDESSFTSTRVVPSDTASVEIETPDGGHVTLDFLSGAVEGKILTFKYFERDLPDSITTNDPDGLPLQFFSLDLSPSDTTTFELCLVVRYTSAQLDSVGITDETQLKLFRFNEMNTSWVQQETTIDTVGNTAKVIISKLSAWSLAAVSPTGISDQENEQDIPEVFTIQQNYPNPFNPSTTIAFEVPQKSHITITVYNILGQEVVRLVDEVKVPGRYQTVWRGRNGKGRLVGSGIYIYRLESGTGFIEAKRMILIK